MGSRRFLLFSFLLFLLLLAGYPLLVINVGVAKSEVPYAYRQLLLEESKRIRGKVIIESGSNSLRGIDPLMLAEYFDAPVINMAVNASYPLGPKLKNIARYVQPGDVLILPLEWHIYAQRDAYFRVFTQKFFSRREGATADYFRSLSGLEQVQAIYTKIPLRDTSSGVTKGLLERYYRFRRHQERIFQEGAASTGESAPIRLDKETLTLYPDRRNEGRARRFYNRALAGDSGAFASALDSGPMELSPSVLIDGELRSCDDYLFSPLWESGYNLDKRFAANLGLLQELQSAGVRVYFTWPVVADHPESRCYQQFHPLDDLSLEEYAQRIRRVVGKAGFQFVGQYEESHYASDCFLNTYYHVISNCARIRTRKLIDDLSSAGVAPIDSTHTPKDLLKFVRERMVRFLKQRS